MNSIGKLRGDICWFYEDALEVANISISPVNFDQAMLIFETAIIRNERGPNEARSKAELNLC